jgi:hypothetical protein
MPVRIPFRLCLHLPWHLDLTPASITKAKLFPIIYPLPHLQLTLSFDYISYQRQSFHRKSHHVLLPILTSRLHFPRHSSLLTRHCQRHIPRRPVPCGTSGRSSSSTLRHSIRASQCLACVLSEARDYLGCGAFVVFEVGFCPPGVGDAGFEGVECQAAFVIAGGAGEGEEGSGDKTACCLFIC